MQEPDDIRQVLARLGDLREDLAEHRGDVREQMARIDGVMQTLSEVKQLEHTRLDGDITAMRHRAKSTEAALDVYVAKVDKVSRRLDRMTWVGLGIGFGSSLGGGTLAYALAQTLGI